MTNKKSPKDNIVSGKVRKIKMGRKKKLRKERSKATIKAVKAPLIETPSNSCAAKKTAKALKSKLSKNFFIHKNRFLSLHV